MMEVIPGRAWVGWVSALRVGVGVGVGMEERLALCTDGLGVDLRSWYHRYKYVKMLYPMS
jgi:hypothetical protein